MIRESMIRELAAMYLRTEINTWENIKHVAERWPNSPKAMLNVVSAGRSLVCYKALLNDLEAGNIMDDLQLAGGATPPLRKGSM